MDGFIIGLFVGVCFMGGFAWLSERNWHHETVARGLAIYCPENGQWSWIGECGE